jgi:hypothetical protein
MKKLLVALLLAVLCSAFLVPVASAHIAARQDLCQIAGVGLTNCDGYPSRQIICEYYSPGEVHDQYDPPQCSPQSGINPGGPNIPPPSQQPPFYCIGAYASCQGVPRAIPPADNGNTDAIIQCLQAVTLEVGGHLVGLGEVIDVYNVGSAIYSEGKDIIVLYKTSDAPGPASVKLVIDVYSSIIPFSGCASITAIVLAHLKNKVASWFHRHYH